MNNILTINPVQQWLSDSDIEQARILKHWLEEELHVSIHEIEGIEISQDMIEHPPMGGYKVFKPGRFVLIILTLLDGSKLHRSFRKEK